MQDKDSFNENGFQGVLPGSVKTLIADGLIALSAVGLYSPGLLALRPGDPSILRAGSSIVCGVVLAWLTWKVNFAKAPEPKRIETSDVETPRQVIDALRSLDGGIIFKGVVRDSIAQMERLDRYVSSYPALLAAKFPPGSLSYDKFDAIISGSVTAMLKNGAALVNRIRLFDEEGYKEIRVLVETGRYHRDTIPDHLQEEKYRVYQKSYQSIRDIVNLNESIQLKLDALSIEISSLDTKDIEVENNRIVDEIQTLIEETKLYE